MKLKRILSMLLAVILAIVAIPYAHASTYSDGDFKYTVSNNQATIEEYIGSGGDIVLPSKFGDYPVTQIASYAFAEKNVITSITIPEGIANISTGIYAFRSCYKIADIYISDLADWFKISFYDNLSNPLFFAENLYLDGKLVEDLVIPDSINTIGNYSFYGYAKLKSVTMPDSVTNIGSSAFAHCTNLESVTISEKTTSINGRAFWGCINLTDITIPESVTSIGDYAFSECAALSRVVMPSMLKTIGQFAFSACTSLSDFTIPGYVSNMGKGIFSDCTNLKSVTLSEGITYIANSTFQRCSNLSNVLMPSTLNTIGDYAFTGCSGLINLTIPEGVKSIQKYAFEDCTGILSISIPSTLESFGHCAFEGCIGLTSVNISDIVAWCNIPFYAIYYNTPLIYAKELYLNGELVKNLVIPDGISSINEYTFYNCTEISSVTIPEGVTSISDHAFEGCKNLTVITIPQSVTSIGNTAFNGCSNLDTINGYAGSYAETYASSNDKTFVTLVDSYATISYDANGGEAAPNTETFESGNCYTISTEMPSLSGHTFKGWALHSEAETPVYFPGGSYILQDSIKLYAVWEKNDIAGDLNDDGSIDLKDISLLERFVKGANIILK